MSVNFSFDEKNISVILDETNLQINNLEQNVQVNLENQFKIEDLSDKTLVKILMLKGEKGDAGATTGASWGYVTGDITDQTDLISLIQTDLANYYTKSETYTKTEVNNLVSSIPQFSILVVNALPTQDISPTTIYLVPKTESDTNDVYNEYIYINLSWELIGSTQIDLSNYYTSSEVDTLLGNKQDILVSGSNIKTINNTSLLGSGNISISSGGTATDVQINGTSITSNDVANIVTEGTYNASTNKIATKSDIPTKTSDLTNDSGFIDTETDPVFSASASASITSNDITNWNNKSNFSGSYNDLTNKPTIPNELSDLSDDSTHRLVTDTEKATWNAKSDFSGSYTDLADKPTIPSKTSDLTNDSGFIDSSYHDNTKQDTLISGTNIKTINNTSILGSGNISIGGGLTFDDIYPIGSIYMSVNNTSPSTLFGGTWVQIKDTFLLSAGDTYTAGDTGGSATHTLTVDEIPSHNHIVRPFYGGVGNGNALQRGYSGSSTSINYGSENTGGGQAHNNMPPYLVVYMWKRTA